MGVVAGRGKMTAKLTAEELERQNLLARINELEQILNNERTVGRQKMLDELGEYVENEINDGRGLSVEPTPNDAFVIKDIIKSWQPKGEE